MSAVPRSPVWRLAIAGLISLLVHAAALWLPTVSLPRNEEPLPLLTAKLVALPEHPPGAAQVEPKPGYRTPAPEPSGIATFSAKAELPKSAVAAASAVAGASAVAAASGVSAEPSAAASAPPAAPAASAAPPAVDYAKTSDHAQPLPKHARLRFVARLGTRGMYVGEVRHDLTVENNHYTLHAELETTGLAGVFKRYKNIQESRGRTSAHGLQPDKFTEDKTDQHGTQRSEADFDWAAHQISFSSGEKAPLPDGAQDILSLLYQASQLPYARETIPIAVSNGRKLEHYQLDTGAEEVIETPMGLLRGLHLMKVRKPGEEGLEVWLGTEYRLLPIKLRMIERDGKVGGEVIITEIRVSDE